MFKVEEPYDNANASNWRRCEYNIKMDLREEGWGYGWIDLAQDRDMWRALVYVVMNLRVPQNEGDFLTSQGAVSF